MARSGLCHLPAHTNGPWWCPPNVDGCWRRPPSCTGRRYGSLQHCRSLYIRWNDSGTVWLVEFHYSKQKLSVVVIDLLGCEIHRIIYDKMTGTSLKELWNLTMGSRLRVSNGGRQQKPLGAGGVHHLRLLYEGCARVVFRGGMVEFDGRQSMLEGIAEER